MIRIGLKTFYVLMVEEMVVIEDTETGELWSMWYHDFPRESKVELLRIEEYLDDLREQYQFDSLDEEA